ncbi:MAG TPA: sulfotransferase [Clostridia bacterium]|jgi:hypothetical protein|nr:MAG: hypothetical protein BWX97_01115 [Firmicutes bacterium ADurb.Bin146]HOD92946.1 sulfotransferase [Clostridia bacterium]HQM39282.1 sulfotransferase [Clostridia bacterium]
MLVTVIGRGHSGTRAISQTLSESKIYMGEPLNKSWDLIPPQDMYEACRVFARYVKYLGNMKWDFSKVLTMDPDPDFIKLIESYLFSVLSSNSEKKGWKIPETTLVYPWIQKMFPDAYYIHWVRDPRDCILSGHMTDDLNDFGIEYDKSDDVRKNRAISWYYQRELVRSTPAAKRQINIRFEDMVFEQNKTIERLEQFLNIPIAKIPMRTDSVGRYLTDNEIHMYDFFKNDMLECGYKF